MSAEPALADWNTLRVFLAVARTGGLRAAAESIGVTHATVSRSLSGLEAALDTRLFDRSRAGMAPTQAGEDLMKHAEAMELQTIAIQRSIAGRDTRPSGRVRLSVPPVVAFSFLPPMVAEFSARYPEVELAVQISNSFLDFERFETDVSIRIAFEVEGTDVTGRRVIRYLKGIYAAPSYLETLPDLTPGDGTGAIWIGWGDPDPRPAWLKASPFPRAAARHGFPEAMMHVEAAASGMGLTYLPCFFGDPDPRLVRVPGTVPQEDRSIWLLLHSDLKRTARVRVLVDFLAEAILAQRVLLRGGAESVAPVLGQNH